MKIPSSLALGMQTWLQVLADNCYCADAFTSGFGAESNNERWQVAIDTIYRFFACELLFSPPAVEGVSKDELLATYKEYVITLANRDPFSYPLEIEWIEWDLCGTERCRELLRKHGLLPDTSLSELNESFIDELEAMFERNGVGWQENPLIRIRG